MSSSVGKIATAKEFFDFVLTKDLEDFRSNQGDIRKCWHSATSLFHQADWVFNQHYQKVVQDFALPQGTTKEADFADALAAQSGDFQLIRGVANSSKHHTLRSTLTNPAYSGYQPRFSANTVYQVSHSPPSTLPVVEVALQGPGGSMLVVLPVAERVYLMWQGLFAKYSW